MCRYKALKLLHSTITIDEIQAKKNCSYNYNNNAVKKCRQFPFNCQNFHGPIEVFLKDQAVLILPVMPS